MRQARVCHGMVLHFGWMPKHAKHMYHMRPWKTKEAEVCGPAIHYGYIQLGEDND